MQSQGVEKTPIKARKVRNGARGSKRVRTGCRTCKIRHKKCDELKPACTQCISTQRTCDFVPNLSSLVMAQIHRPLSPFHEGRNTDAIHFTYFRTICAPDFTLYFEVPIWEGLVLQAATTEPSIHHAALAISALSRIRCHPDHSGFLSRLELELFAITQYNLAIRTLSQALDESNRSKELAVLASVIFIALEVLQDGSSTAVGMHLENAKEILRSHEDVVCPQRMISPGTEERGDWRLQVENSASSELGHLVDAMERIGKQFEVFASFQSQ